MPTAQQADQNAVAYQHLMANVYHPPFFGKLAAAGVHPRDRSEAERLLEMGFELHRGYQEKAAQTRDERDGLLDYAFARFDAMQGNAPEKRAAAYDEAARGYANQHPDALAAAITVAEAIAGL
jgi:hypothetical protein